MIEAPAERVWALLSDIDHWSSWQPDIRWASRQGPLRSGVVFVWSAGGARVASKLQRVRAPEELAWTGSAFGLRAVHVWTLTPQGHGAVLVRTRESMEGFPTSLLFSSSALANTDRRWLESLKQRAEAKP